MFYADFKGFVLLLSISCFSLTVLVSMDVTSGTWRAIRWLDFCTAWRKGVRRVWNVPADTHCYILPLLCECLPVYDEDCRRSVKCLRTCISHSSKVVRCVANYSIYHGRDVVTLLLAGMYYTVWTELELHWLTFCLQSLTDWSASMPQKTFTYSVINQLICCMNVLWFVTMFLLCLFVIL